MVLRNNFRNDFYNFKVIAHDQFGNTVESNVITREFHSSIGLIIDTDMPVEY